MNAAIYGFAGPSLTDDERSFFRALNPCGYILFKRNIESPEQVKALTDSLRELSGRDRLPILIDQEGGRVARMRSPVWPDFPCAEKFDALYQIAPISAIEAVRANSRALALMLAEVGVTVDCLPLLDVRQKGASDIIGDRALGAEPMQVAALGRATLNGLASGGVVGVVKHIPGHGRALVDSHHELPIVTASDDELEIDLEPFQRLNWAPMAMVAHVVYEAWDRNHPSSQSEKVIADIIRGRIGFDNFLMSDDSGMNALSGSPGERAGACVDAGCDVALPCDGVFENNQDVANHVGDMTEVAVDRLERATASVNPEDDGITFAEAIEKRDQLFKAALA